LPCLRCEFFAERFELAGNLGALLAREFLLFAVVGEFRDTEAIS